MKSAVRCVIAASLSLGMSGCLALGGPKTPLSAYGPEQGSRLEESELAEGRVEHHGLLTDFRRAERRARPDEVGRSDHDASLTMQRAGLALVRANCDDYFRQAGHTQRASNVSRQLIAASNAIASTILLSDDGNESLVQYLGIGTSASYALIDVYTENFLFSAANISSVRELVMSELDGHLRELSETDRTYAAATRAVMDHQAICLPQNIANLVREAIEEKTIAGAAPGTGRRDLEALQAALVADAAARNDRDVLRRLRFALDGGEGALTNDQAGSLWWLINGQTTAEMRSGPIAAHLKGFAKGPFPTDVYVPGWEARTAVVALIDELSETRQSSYRRDAAIFTLQPPTTVTFADPTRPQP